MTFTAICQICNREYQGDTDVAQMHCLECQYALAALPPITKPLIYSLVERIRKLEERAKELHRIALFGA